MSVSDFCSTDTVSQIGIAPNRIGLLMSIGDICFSSTMVNCTETI